MNFPDFHHKKSKLLTKPLSTLIAMTAGALFCAPSLKSEAKVSPHSLSELHSPDTYSLKQRTQPDAQSLEQRIQKLRTAYALRQNPDTGKIQKFSWGNWGNGHNGHNDHGSWGNWGNGHNWHNGHCNTWGNWKNCHHNWNNWNNWGNAPRHRLFWANL